MKEICIRHSEHWIVS